MPIEKIIVVEDDLIIRRSLEAQLRHRRCEVLAVPTLAAAKEALGKDTFDLIFLDVRLPDGEGTDWLKELQLRPQRPLVVIMTGFGSVESAVDCMRNGAFDYLIKPFSEDQIDIVLRKAEDFTHILRVNQFLSGEGGDDGSELLGRSPAMERLRKLIRQVARTQATVLIQGESGTGKELVARALHKESPRASAPLIKVNCAAIPENLIESEFFGHEKGAFTGAMTQRKGRFEQADSGTLFLDEVGEVSAAFQSKLLRVLQEGEMERVGGNRTIKVDVRVIAATHRDLEGEVAAGRFREDLYYRLNVMPIYLPSLRERLEDIPDIARFLVDKIARQQARPLSLTDAALRVLMHHAWPGNVRELENCLERAAVLTEAEVIDRDAILLTGIEEQVSLSRGAMQAVDLDDPNLDERERVIAALEQAGWVQAKAARLLDMTPRQIAYRIQTLNIKVKQI